MVLEVFRRLRKLCQFMKVELLGTEALYSSLYLCMYMSFLSSFSSEVLEFLKAHDEIAKDIADRYVLGAGQ